MKRTFTFALALAWCVAGIQAATLERLSLDEMIAQSTSIVQGKVTAAWAAFSGPVIYTHYKVEVSQQLKGTGSPSIEVVVPGGTANNLRQTFAGAPELKTGEEYVLMLWTGKSGATQIIGLTQGLFSIPKDAGSNALATRSASREPMIERTTGRAVKDETLIMHLSELRARIAGNSGGAKAQ